MGLVLRQEAEDLGLLAEPVSVYQRGHTMNELHGTGNLTRF